MARLLLLDDEEEALEWMTTALEGMGHEVHSYRSGRDALANLCDWHPDLIVSDILMPEMDGLAFARLVRSHRGPPILFISIAFKQAEAVLAGAVGYVQRPTTADELRTAVADVLGHERRRATILVVDDDDAAREVFAHYLRPFEVVDAANGMAALTELRTRPIDLVITDIHMPLMNGLELIRALRADPELERIPVIVQTSDRLALSSPAWRELKVAYRMEKVAFARWLRHQVDASLPSRATRTRQLDT